MNNKVLEINELEVVYRTDDAVVKAVNGISFNMSSRETLALVGETGAGKTTTALSIMRLLPERTGIIKQGKIILDGENILDKKESEMRKIRGSKISMIFQDPMTSLNPLMTVGDQILEVLSIHNYDSLSKHELNIKVEELLGLVGIPTVRRFDYPHQFSGGMKQRIVIAIALACNPEVLIADEPTTALDVTIQAQVMKLIEDLKAKFNTSILLITHDLGIVAEISDKVAIMYAGQIIEFGTVREVFEEGKHHPYTEGLFDSIPDLNGKSKRLKPIPGLMPDSTNLPSGCKFHPRCSKALEICSTEEPACYIFGSHSISCHLFNTNR